ncbi:DNA polymerase/3'-5' exonuclease PolX [Patescibacteria group bacterium]|nr:DNA polymerase/3'-5' exonuclease PolX [Patescibacteria group bacterium]
MSNKTVADTLYEISLILDAEGVSFKPQAYEEAANTVRSLDEELSDLYKKCGLKCIDDLPGIGQSIAEKIEELLKTGRLAYYQKLKKKYPLDLLELTNIQNIGAKTAIKLYKKLGIKTVADLEKAAHAQKISKLKGFGQRTELDIIRQIAFKKLSRGRFLIHSALPLTESIIKELKSVSGVTHCEVAGSVRRRQETIGDIDLLITTSKPELAIKKFVSLPEIERVLEKGPSKIMVRYRFGMNGDLRILKPEEYGSALQYFTGDKEHNIALRKIAIKKGYKLSEYGLFKGKKHVAGKTEEGIYKTLGLDWIPPEIRTNSGELEAAAKHQLPDLIPYGSLKGDLQVQTNWSDGESSILEMAKAARAAGLSYIGITDHTQTLAVAHGLNEDKLKKQITEIDRVNKKIEGFKVLKSTECEILPDGRLDLKDEVLKKLDYVSVAIHGRTKMSSEEMTQRLIRALKHPLTNVLLHPTGRIVNYREAYKMDFAQVMRAAVQYGVALEINSSYRLDLKDTLIRQALKAGVKFTISSDTHSPAGFADLQFGLAQARRGWTTKADVLNTKPVDSFPKALKGLKK